MQEVAGLREPRAIPIYTVCGKAGASANLFVCSHQLRSYCTCVFEVTEETFAITVAFAKATLQLVLHKIYDECSNFRYLKFFSPKDRPYRSKTCITQAGSLKQSQHCSIITYRHTHDLCQTKPICGSSSRLDGDNTH
jgi:hypothetical protein